MADLQAVESAGFVTSRCSALSHHVAAPPTRLDPFRASQNVISPPL